MQKSPILHVKNLIHIPLQPITSKQKQVHLFLWFFKAILKATTFSGKIRIICIFFSIQMFLSFKKERYANSIGHACFTRESGRVCFEKWMKIRVPGN